MEKLISHEIPLALIDHHQDFVSDYMFALLHKYVEDSLYARKVYEYRDAGGMVYLDNSCFELGEAMSDELLHGTYDKLRPDIVILPDVLGDRQKTLTRVLDYLDKYPEDITNAMVVAQGATANELIDCYFNLINYRDRFDRKFPMIGIPFVYSWLPKEPEVQASGRIDLLCRMIRDKDIDETRKHHLFGTWQAREFINYRNFKWIYSIDTSNPVMAAVDGTTYGPLGIDNKPTATFDKAYHLKEVDIDMNLLYHNVRTFKEIVNGRKS